MTILVRIRRACRAWAAWASRPLAADLSASLVLLFVEAIIYVVRAISMTLTFGSITQAQYQQEQHAVEVWSFTVAAVAGLFALAAVAVKAPATACGQLLAVVVLVLLALPIQHTGYTPTYPTQPAYSPCYTGTKCT